VPAKRAEVGRVTVSYGDLNLGNDGDARVMLSRLQQAAYRACGGDPRWNPDYALLWNRLATDYRECRNDAVSRAVAAIDAPVLSQVYRGDQDQRLVRDIDTSRR
jgi:UrcA family protein